MQDGYHCECSNVKTSDYIPYSCVCVYIYILHAYMKSPEWPICIDVHVCMCVTDCICKHISSSHCCSYISCQVPLYMYTIYIHTSMYIDICDVVHNIIYIDERAYVYMSDFFFIFISELRKIFIGKKIPYTYAYISTYIQHFICVYT